MYLTENTKQNQQVSSNIFLVNFSSIIAKILRPLPKKKVLDINVNFVCQYLLTN